MVQLTLVFYPEAVQYKIQKELLLLDLEVLCCTPLSNEEA